MAMVFLIGPDCFTQLSQASVQYSEIDTLAWGAVGDAITYGYDDNGSLETKDTLHGDGSSQTVVNTYNLQGRLESVTTEEYDDATPTPNLLSTSTTTYKYNPQGIRISKDVDGTVTDYLIDQYNHTGYAQVFEETQGSATTAYIIGDDILAQSKGMTATNIDYLLYDGHGSTRQLIDTTGLPAGIIDSYSYDSYGTMLGADNTEAENAETTMLYSGEQYDSQLDQYYNRARYYNQNNGTFNRVDPYSGNTQDPQSLHKYAYCHNNPINAIDPSGMISVTQVAISLSISMIIATINAGVFVTIAKRIVPVIQELKLLAQELRTINPAGADIVEKGIIHLRSGLIKFMGISAFLTLFPVAGVALSPLLGILGSMMAIGGSATVTLTRLHNTYSQIAYVMKILQEGLTFDNGNIFGIFRGRLNLDRSAQVLTYMPKLLARHIGVLTEAIRRYNAGDSLGFAESFWDFGNKMRVWGDFGGIIGKRKKVLGIPFAYGIGFLPNPHRRVIGLLFP